MKLTSLNNKYASEVSNVRSSIQNVDQKTNTLTNSVNQLQTKVQQVAGMLSAPSPNGERGHFCTRVVCKLASRELDESKAHVKKTANE